MLLRKLVTVAVALVTLVVAGAADGCNSDRGGGAPPPQAGGNGAQAAGPVSYVVRLNGLDADARPLQGGTRREVICIIEGYKNDPNNPVIVTDVETGRTGPYSVSIETFTGRRLRVYDYANVERIDVHCTLFGEPGDSLQLEINNGAETGAAPLLDDHSFAIIPNGANHISVWATIIAN